jgi:hypothetical protein
MAVPRARYFEALGRHELSWDWPFLAFLRDSSTLFPPSEALAVFSEQANLQTAILKLSILSYLEAILSRYTAPPKALVEAVKRLWSSLHTHPGFLSVYPQYCPEEVGPAIAALLAGFPTRVENALPLLSPTEFAIASAQFTHNLFTHVHRKFAFFLLSENIPYDRVNLTTCVTELTLQIFKSGSVQYSNRVSTVVAETRTKKTVLESVILEQEDAQLRDVLGDTFIEAELVALKKSAARITAAFTSAFAVTGSSLKPDCYKSRKPITPSNRAAASIPSPANSDRHACQELHYARSRFVTLTSDTVHVLSHPDGDDISINLTELLEKLNQFSPTIDAFFSEGNRQLVRTWSGIAEICRRTAAENANNSAALSITARAIHRRCRREVHFHDAFANGSRYLQLAGLRKTEDDNLREDRIFQKQVEAKTNKKYRDRIAGLSAERTAVLAQFPRSFEVLFTSGQSAVSAQLEKVDQVLGSITANMAFAKTSLAESDSWYEKSAKLREQRGDPPYDPLAPEEVPIERPEDWLIEKEPPMVIVARAPSPVKPYNNDMVLTKIDQTKAEIVELGKKILFERLVRTVMRVGTISYHTRMIAKVGEDRRLAARQLWNGKRVFEEEIAALDASLQDAYRILATTDLETEKLRAEIDAVKKLTVKLSHWKDVNLRSADLVNHEIERLTPTGDVNVDKLLAALEDRQGELDAINNESSAFNEELDYSVHEPMKEVEAAKRTIRKLAIEKMALRKIFEESEERPTSTSSQELFEMNENLRVANGNLRQQIRDLEEKKKLGGSEREKYVDNLFPPTVYSARTRASATVTKPVPRKPKPKTARPLYLNV